MPETPLPKHPYRDAVLFQAAFSVIIVLVAWATAGDIRRAVFVAAGYFVVATAWTCWRFRERIRRDAREAEL